MVERDWDKVVGYRREPSHTVLNQQMQGLEDFAKEATQARKRVSTFSMIVEPEIAVPMFKNALPDIDKKVVFDAFTKFVSQGKILAIYEKIPGKKEWVEQEREKYREMIQDFSKAGTIVEVWNHPRGWERFFPFTNRLHRKGSYADDTFYIQTGNLTQDPSADVMIKITGEPAENLIAEFTKINGKSPEEDYFVEVAADTHLYVDTGKPGKSLILDTALDMVHSAKHSVQNFSFLWPDGKIAKSLQQKHQEGKNVEVLTTKFYKDPGIFTAGNVLYAISLLARTSYHLHRYTFPVFLDPYRAMHVKGLLVDETTAFIGSHNLNSRGVQAGTKEWQILTTNKAIVDGLKRKFVDYKEVITAPHALMQ